MFKYEALELKITKQADQFEKFRLNSMAIQMEVVAAKEEKYLMNLAVRVLDKLPKGAPVQSEATASLLANEGGVKADTEMMISRQVFRATRGNTFTISEVIEEEIYDAKVEKYV